MAVDERDRHRLVERLEAVLGQDEAAILMEHLPPVGWADVATKRDLDALALATTRDLEAHEEANRLEHEVLKLAIEASKHEVIATLRADMNHQTRTMFFGMATMLVGFGGLILTGIRLFS